MSSASIVLIHGWGVDNNIWQTLQTQLPNIETLALSLPGYGDQYDNKTEWKLETLAQDLVARSPSNAIWVGWSLGGLLSAATALLYPKHIKALLNIATIPCFIQRPGWDCAMDEPTFDTFVQSCRNDNKYCLEQFYKLIGHGADRTTIKCLKQLSCSANKNTLLNGLELLKHTDLRLAYKNLPCPSRHLFAADDVLVPAIASQRIAIDSNKTDITLVHSASHALPISHSKTIAQHIKARVHVQH